MQKSGFLAGGDAFGAWWSKNFRRLDMFLLQLLVLCGGLLGQSGYHDSCSLLWHLPSGSPRDSWFMDSSIMAATFGSSGISIRHNIFQNSIILPFLSFLRVCPMVVLSPFPFPSAYFWCLPFLPALAVRWPPLSPSQTYPLVEKRVWNNKTWFYILGCWLVSVVRDYGAEGSLNLVVDSSKVDRWHLPFKHRIVFPSPSMLLHSFLKDGNGHSSSQWWLCYCSLPWTSPSVGTDSPNTSAAWCSQFLVAVIFFHLFF